MRNLIAMILGLAFLIVSVDFIEQLRKYGSNENISLGQLYLIAALRAPHFIEKAFPFACLFAAMICLTQLNTKLELVVARAAGVSAWQFLLPISISSAIVGLAVAVFYNPLAISSSKLAKDLTAQILSSTSIEDQRTVREYWIKQVDTNGGYSIINAELARRGGQLLDNVKILRYAKDGEYLERIDAVNMVHRGSHWIVLSGKRYGPKGKVSNLTSKKMNTTLTKDDLIGISAKPDEISFWQLLNVAKQVEKSGTNGKPYLVQYHSLTALPAFLFAMVLVAASVCLKFVRFGQVGKMILGGILFGFVLYTITSLITALGSNGVVPPIVAAWSPACVAILFGMSSLLHQEDG
jgi:lipopolysaccharide export system permease protein